MPTEQDIKLTTKALALFRVYDKGGHLELRVSLEDRFYAALVIQAIKKMPPSHLVKLEVLHNTGISVTRWMTAATKLDLAMQLEKAEKLLDKVTNQLAPDNVTRINVMREVHEYFHKRREG